MKDLFGRLQADKEGFSPYSREERKAIYSAAGFMGIILIVSTILIFLICK